MTITVSPTNRKNTHHIKLSRGGTDLGLILCDRSGKEDPTQIDINPLGEMGVRIYEGEQEYSDMELPATAQKEWLGGRGSRIFEADKTRYADGRGIDTSYGGKIILGPQVGYMQGVRNWIGHYRAQIWAWHPLVGDQQGIQTKFTADKSIDTWRCWIWVRRKGSPTNVLKVSLYNDSLGQPGIELDNDALTYTIEAGMTYIWPAFISYSVVQGTTYHVVVSTDNENDLENCWEIGGAPGYDGDRYPVNPYKHGIDYPPCFRLVGDVSTGLFIPHFVEYKGALYLGTEPLDGSAGKLYREGYMGACDDNTGDLMKLKDATQTDWDNTEAGYAKVEGGYVEIFDGVAPKEREYWRPAYTYDVGTGSVYVEPAWTTAHNTNTNYLIKGTRYFHEISQTAITKPITDLAVANDILYIAQGDQANLIMHRAINQNGSWLEADSGSIKCFLDGQVKAHKLHVRNDPALGEILYMIYQNPNYHYKNHLIQQVAPTKWNNSAPRLSGVLLENCADAWDEQTISNITVSYTDEHMIKVAVAAGFGTGVLCSEAISAVDIRHCNKITLKIISSIDLEAGDLQLLLDNTAQCASPVLLANFPALAANEPTRVTFTFNPAGTAGFEAIISIGLKLINNKDAFDLYLFGPIYAVKDYIPVEMDERITNLANYGETSDELWIVTEKSIGKLADNVYLPEQIYALRRIGNPHNGAAVTTNDTYLYISYGDDGGILRYNNGVLDEVGVNQDEGLPSERIGPVVAMINYPGCIFAAIDGGTSGYSSILKISGKNVCEVYRAPQPGYQIQGDLFIQEYPGSTVGKLYFGMQRDICYIYVSLDPLHDAAYQYNYEGVLITGLITSNMLEVDKWYRSISLVSSGLSELETQINNVYVDFRIGVDGPWIPTGTNYLWTTIGTPINNSPSQKIDIPDTDINGNSTNGKWIELRFRIYGDSISTPQILSWVMQYIRRLPITWTYTIIFKLEDGGKDLLGQPESQTAAEKYEQLKTWLEDALPVTMYSTYSLENGITARIDPPSLRILRRITDPNRNTSVYICQMRLTEV